MNTIKARTLRSEDDLISKMALGFLFTPLFVLAAIAAVVAI